MTDAYTFLLKPVLELGPTDQRSYTLTTWTAGAQSQYYVSDGDGVLSSKTLSWNALSSKEHWSNGTLVKLNIGRMEH